MFGMVGIGGGRGLEALGGLLGGGQAQGPRGGQKGGGLKKMIGDLKRMMGGNQGAQGHRPPPPPRPGSGCCGGQGGGFAAVLGSLNQSQNFGF